MANRILIVEDHRDMMQILRKYLKEHKFESIGAENAELGIEQFKEAKPDLVLMDLMLPGMSGIEAIRKIRELPQEDRYTPIIILTAKNEVQDIVEGLDAGADDYIVKPFNFEELIARIRTAMRLKDLNELLLTHTQELSEANEKISQLNSNLLSKNKELRKNVYNLHSLFEVSMDLNSILNLHRLINSVLLTLVGQFSCKNALFFLASKPEIERLALVNSKGFYMDNISDMYFEKKDKLCAFFQKNPTPATLRSLSRRVRNSTALKQLKEVGVQIATPILIKGKTEGIICLGPRMQNQNYLKSDLEHISILGNIISIAVANASLYYEVEQLSYTDGMTELHNFRYFELRLKEEIVRQNRLQNGLSLLILDVDNFKNYNDTKGHPAGDVVLKKLAHILRETVRENDIVARYGGEEFAIILPGVEKEGARILAERIRENVETTYFEHEEIQPLGKVTVSIGGSSMPDDGVTYEDLLNSADDALYVAKNSGRNKVCIAKGKD